MFDELSSSWRSALADELEKSYLTELERFVKDEREKHQIFPPQDEVFAAFDLTPFEKVEILLVGQDPYHGEGQAHGLCFSVRPGVKPPPSLVNIYKELAADLEIEPPGHGCLSGWAERGVLMLNTVLTVRAHEANSHRGRGWETFTDAVIRQVNEKTEPVVFVLWGNPARKKAQLVDPRRHVIIEAPHPSPLSASRGFFGCRCFSSIDAAIRGFGRQPIDWHLDEL